MSVPDSRKVTIPAPHQAKRDGQKIVAVVAGLGLLQRIADRAGVDGAAAELAHLAIVTLADERRAAAILESLPLRGWAIVLSDGSRDEILAGITAANAGFGAMPASWSARPVEASVAWAGDDGPDEPLTTREQDVLELLSLGLSNKRIAERLGISEHTVKFHVASIYGKLGAASRAEAIRRAARRGLIDF